MNQVLFKKTSHLELNDAYLKVLYWFFAYPTKEISLNDLIKKTSISKTTGNRIVSKLAEEGFLKVSTLGKVWRISCNQEHIYNSNKKIPYNLGLVYESGIVEKVLSVVKNPRSIILFGSYRKGDDADTSDLDIAVETFDNEDVKIIPLGTIPQLGFRQNIKVSMLKFSRNKIELNLFSNIANGIILYGFFEVRP